MISGIMAMMAVGTDFMLPAFGDIEDEFGLVDGQSAQVITVFFFGLAIAQLFYGPLADALGRKKVLYLSLTIYVIGAIASALAPTFTLMLVGRLVWGIGAAGARVVATSIIRDRFEGAAMASAMSQMMGIFVLVPIIAPGLGSAILLIAPWRALYWVCAAVAGALALWSLRLSETLDPANRRPLNLRSTLQGYAQVARTPVTFGYTWASLFLQGVFTTYLASSESIVDRVFDLRPLFPFIFGAVAVLFGIAAIINSSVVERLGVDRIVTRTFAVMLPLTLALVVISVTAGGEPSIWLFMPVLGLILASFMFLMPNLGSAAMMPVGKLAGSGSALTGAFRTAGGAFIATVIAPWTDGSTTGLAIAVAIMCPLAGLCVLSVRMKNQPPVDPTADGLPGALQDIAVPDAALQDKATAKAADTV